MSEDDVIREETADKDLACAEATGDEALDAAPEEASEQDVDCCPAGEGESDDEAESTADADDSEQAADDTVDAASDADASDTADPAAAADEEADTASESARTARRRRLMVAALCLALFAVALGSQTLSFLVREYPVAGRLAFDGVALDALITTHDAKGEEVVAKSEDKIPLGMVGLDRTVRFKNTGAQTLWVRARADFSLLVGGERHGLADLTEFDVNGDDWAERDGWFYLIEPLEPGAVSPALITGLTVDTQTAHDRYGSGTYQLDAHAGAVQRKHNADSVLDAEGWPE